MNDSGKESCAVVNREIRPSAVVRGSVYSFTRVQEPPAGFEAQAPYYLALVQLEDGHLITSQLTDVDDDVEIGDRVEMVTRKLTTDGQRGIIVYGYKFRPAMK